MEYKNIGDDMHSSLKLWGFRMHIHMKKLFIIP